MSKIESKTGIINASDERIYTFLSDFKNFHNLIPADKVKNWIADEDSCSFTLDGIGDASLKIIEKNPFSMIKITSGGKTPVNFFLWIQIKKIEDEKSGIRVVIEPDVNQMMMMMVKGPLQNFVDMLIDQVGKIKFN
ncbi:MAG: SRPBCC family protein [Bacteroidales bacterium]|nr:SRPBCC family protein [Bacteroidales bacterium]MCB9013370.1 SRPBCC family protein [Bacteroidales bacterium]